MSWFLVILFLSLTFDTSLSEATTNHDDNKKILPSAFVVGTVYCDTCLQQTFTKESHFILGASVAVECKVKNSKPRFYTEVKTNEHGEFKVKLPFSVKKHVKRIKKCSLRLISSSEPHCSIASTTTSTTSLSLKKFQGEHIFSAEDFSFKPMKKPHFCDQKHSTIPNSKEHVYVRHKHSIANFKEHVYVMKSSKKSDFSDQKDVSIFPPLIPNPFQPPPLIPNPLQPPSPPLIPNPFQPSPPPFLPNPFQPPSPPPFLPNPFQPPPSSPPPLIPNPFQPPPSSPPPIFPFPPIVIPGLTPSPPPPPQPKSVFPFPLPPLFPPPHSPGSPPTSSKHSSP